MKGRKERARPQATDATDLPDLPFPSTGQEATGADSAGKAAPLDGAGAPVDVGVVIVGVGASAGGLEALKELFSGLVRTESVSYVIAQHLSPTHASLMKDLLKPGTSLELRDVTDGAVPSPNVIYITPPNHDVIFHKGRLRLTPPRATVGPKPSVDRLFQSLAESNGEDTVGIILSGTGSDGAVGIRAIKGAGGLTMVQDPQTAKYDGMPRASINTGAVDLTLAPAAMGKTLAGLIAGPDAQRVTSSGDGLGAVVEPIAAVVKRQSGVDLTHYKSTTVNRRIRRRMGLRQIHTIQDYQELLKKDAVEATQLSKDVLICVTSFFRDPEAFDALRVALRRLFERRKGTDVFRIWVPGCATGEEAYSLAILFAELRGQIDNFPEFLIFATDMAPDSIATARQGLYPESIVGSLSPALRKKFFEQRGAEYQIKKSLRQSMVFSTQNVIEDPPFSKMDMISCRNLLIYFTRDAQKRVLETFHYSLNPGGLLFLGGSESIEPHKDLFIEQIKKARIYKRADGVSHYMKFGGGGKHKLEIEAAKATGGRREADTGSVALNRISAALIGAYCPPSIVIDSDDKIAHFVGDLNPYLRFPQGAAALRVYDMVPETMRAELRALLHRCRREKVPVHGSAFEAKEGEASRKVRAVARLLNTEHEAFVLLSFEPVVFALPDAGAPVPSIGDQSNLIIGELERELTGTRHHLQTVTEELETSNEELQSQSEELQSSNEELQSTNEELQTSNEELQSTNEELLTVNDEMQTKSHELEAAVSDLHNVMESLDVPVLVLDAKLQVTRWNKAADGLLQDAALSTGMNIAGVTTDFDLVPAIPVIKGVIRGGEAANHEMAQGERSYMLRCMPYRNSEDEVVGAVLGFIDITERNRALEALREREALFGVTFSHSGVGMAVLGPDYRILRANAAFARLFDAPGANATGTRCSQYLDLTSGTQIENALAGLERAPERRLQTELELVRKDGIRLWVEVSASVVVDDQGGVQYTIAQFNDVTERRTREQALREETRRQALLNQISGTARAVQSVDQILDGAQAALAELYSQSCVSLYRPAQEGLLACKKSSAPHGVRSRAGETMELAPDDAARVALQTGRVSVNRESSGPLASDAPPAVRVLVPIVHDGAALALLVVESPLQSWRAADQGALEAAVDIIVVAVRDAEATEGRKRALAELQDEKERVEVTLQSIGEGVLTTGVDGLIHYVNRAAESLLGLRAEAVVGRRIEEVFAPVSSSTGKPLDSIVVRCLARGAAVEQDEADAFLAMPDGRRIAVDSSAAPLHNHAGAVIGAVAVVRDITDQRLLTEELSYRASHDQLTGLPNRDEFQRRLRAVFQDAKRNNSHHVLCYMDLDQFKVVNDTAGHSAGDKLLKELAVLVRSRLRQADLLARLGGDEFGIIMSNCPMERGLAVAEEVRQAVQEFRFRWQDKSFTVGASIGVAPINIAADNVADLLARVDSACYQAKEHGRNRVELISTGDDEHRSRRFGEMNVVALVRESIAEDRFTLVVEPIVPIRPANTTDVLYHEALVRLLNDKAVLQMPESFIPAAERYYLMPTLDRWIAARALRNLATSRGGNGVQRVGINLSGQTVADEKFPEFILQRMDEYGVSGESLFFEITETAAITHLTEAAQFMRRLKDRGCSIVLDDFGAGMSSFAYLRKLPIDIVKIDGLFLTDTGGAKTDRALIEAINRIGHDLGMKTVAEQVETEAQLELVRDIGVDYYQGHVFSKPKPWG